MIAKLRTLAVLFTALFILSSVNAQNDLKIKKLTLENGLKVYLHEDHKKPEVFGVVVTNAGGKNDPADATGMAHYMEHMLFKGTTELGTTDWEKEKPHIDKIFSLYDKLAQTEDEEERKKIQKEINEESLKAAEYAIPNELSNLIKSMGGTSLNAGTGPDQTMFYNAFPPSQIEKWIDLYAHRFEEPVFRSFQAELEVVYEEKNMYQDMFIFPILEKFNYNFFKNHPYGQQTLIGTAEDLKNPSLTKMYEFYKTYYVANNMALIISGDFNTDEVIPMIKEHFGKWKSGEIPEYKPEQETEFKGREFIEVKMSPVKLGLLGFRTPPKGHKDRAALEIANMILSNSSNTGIFDKMVNDNKIMAAQAMAMPYVDHGATIFLYVPKIIGQKHEEAEQLVMDGLDSLKQGNFEEWMLDAIKKELYRQNQRSLESASSKALKIADAFILGKEPEEILNYANELMAVTKEDVIRVAKKYYGENYLAFHSKMGSADKDKIDKPGYEPLKANTNAKSVYAKHFEQIPFTNTKINFLNFNDILKSQDIFGSKLYTTENPVNDIATLTIKFGVGNHELPMLKYASDVMNLARTSEMDLDEINKQFAILGCSYNIYSNDSYLTVSLSGIEESMPKAIELVGKIFYDLELEQKRLDVIYDGEKTNRKIEQSEVDNVASALFEYVRYKENSSYLNRLPLKEIKDLEAEKLVEVFNKALKYEAEIHYVGNNKNIGEILKKSGIFPEKPMKSNSPVYRELENYTENTVYFVKKRKARQSKIYYFANGDNFSINKSAKINAFNTYFGGGFSGLVLQEVREYRSLAYTAAAQFATPPLLNQPMYFLGYIGTQADKTVEGLEVFNGLVRDMPQKPERMDMIKDYLILSSNARVPGFRNKTQTVKLWQQKGYSQDPRKMLISDYENMSFTDIMDFYNNNVKEKPMVIAIVGDKKKVGYKNLKNYGNLVKIKKKKLFTK